MFTLNIRLANSQTTSNAYTHVGMYIFGLPLTSDTREYVREPSTPIISPTSADRNIQSVHLADISHR